MSNIISNIFRHSYFKYILLLLFCLTLSCLNKHYDYDLYARLIVGEHFFTNGQLAFKDFLSYTPTHIWYDHEYGASLIFYTFFKLFGPYGLNLINALLLFGTGIFVNKTQRLQTSKLPNLTFLSVLFIGTFSHLNQSIVRCHMFSFFFTAILLYILEKYRLKNSKLIWLIPALILLWNNIHGGVVTGLGITFIYMICELAQRKAWKTYFYILVISTPLLIINPYGIEYLNFLFSANTMSRIYVAEWMKLFSYRHIYQFFAPFVICFTALCLSIYRIKHYKNYTHIILLATTAYLGFTHVKLLSILLIVTFSLFHKEIVLLFNKKLIVIFEKLSYLILIITISTLLTINPLLPRSGIHRFPVLETEFLKVNNIKGNILTSFGLGSYVAYKLYPNNLIYMDGRYEEVYNIEEFNKLKHYELADENWNDVIKDYPTEILMPRKELAIYKYLKEEQNDWIEIYNGEICGIFVKKENLKSKYKKPTENILYYQKTAFDNFGKFSNKPLSKD